MKNLLRLKPYVAQHRWRILGGFIALVLTNYYQLRVARVVGDAADAIKVGGHTPHDFARYAGYIIGFTLVLGIFRYLMRQWIIGASRDIELTFRDDFFK